MKNKGVGFGIVGCGMIAEVHAKAISEAKGGRLVAVTTRNKDRMERFAADQGGISAVESVEDLVRRDDVDVVCITTPSGAHLEPALAAANAGKHVLVEKPIEISASRTDAIIEACSRNGVYLASVFQNRFGNGVQALKQAVDGGRFGNLALCSTYVKWFRDQAYYDEGGWKGTRRLDGGGALMNQGIHAMDLLLWIAGPLVEVSAMKGIRAHDRIEVEDTAVACLKFAHGSFGVIEASTATWPGEARRIEIRGDQGSALLVDDQIVQWDFRTPLESDATTLEECGKEPAQKWGAANARHINSDGHRLQIQNLIDAIHGEEALAVDGREGRKAVEAIEAIYRSAESGTPVSLPLEENRPSSVLV